MARFLYAQMKLIGFDDWNVLMLAADVRTKETCDLAGHPGTVPAVTEVMTKRVVEWKRRYDVALEAFGITATGGLRASPESNSRPSRTICAGRSWTMSAG